ncbi:MAG: hypothetical protein PHG42_08230 [Bacteroides sp.]|nr:hypothetical protein [Bacteroides sp.]MDD4804316.1 hypothetical protein [Candidatus Paceibacterota bacterium]
MRISKRLIKAAIELDYYKDIHGLYCKVYSSPGSCKCPKPVKYGCHYGHINASVPIRELENKIKRITSR